MPSLADERAFYDLMGWARTASDEDFVFSADPGPMSSNTISIHDDDEADSLWTWFWQAQRYGSAVPRAHRDRWLAYFRSGAYRNALPTTSGDFNPPTAADPMCHTYGWGLVTHGVLNGDAVAIAEAEAIADIAVQQVWRGRFPTPGVDNTGWGGGRNRARPAILVAYLAEATGKAKWVDWRNALIDLYLQSPDWQEAPSNGIVQGGAYFCDKPWMSANGQNAGYIGNSRTSYANGDVAYDAGARSNTVYQFALHAEFLWRCLLSTGRADVRDRLIKFARFMQHYAHDPAHTARGGPFCGGYLGHNKGNYWHRDTPTDGAGAHYDISVVNILVWGYKLTGDNALLERAKVHMRQATRWNEGQPGATGEAPQAAANEVWMFVDTHREHFGITDDRFFAFNKGQLQYCYQLFENGGKPALL